MCQFFIFNLQIRNFHRNYSTNAGETALKQPVINFFYEKQVLVSPAQRFPTWVNVPLGFHLPVPSGTLKVSHGREKYFHILLISKYLYIYQSILYFKNHSMLIVKFLT